VHGRVATVALIALAACTRVPSRVDRTAPAAAAPSADRDRDGVPDRRDGCAQVAEDCDGWQDDDGCPEPDDDGDQVPDVCDSCPRAPENYQGFDDDDGCPDHADPVMRPYDVPPYPRVFFARGSAALDATGRADIDGLIAFLRRVPELEVVACVGRTSRDEDAGDALSLARARVVARRMIAAGIAADRLRIEGVADRWPVGSPPDGSDLGLNRSVLFDTLRSAGVERARWTGGRIEWVPPAPFPLPPRPPANPRCADAPPACQAY